MSAAIEIAIVEDHTDLRLMLVGHLSANGYSVFGAGSAEELDGHIARHPVDLLVLDLNLPGEDGLSIARRLRRVSPHLQIIILSARTDEDDRIRGYASGADAYLPKPVSPNELLAAIRSAERRIHSTRQQNQGTRFIILDVQKRQVRGPNGIVSLGTTELALLKAIASAPGRRLDYQRLIELGEPVPEERGKAALEVRIFRLRRKLIEAGADDPPIIALWKEGYQLAVPLQIA